MLASRNSRQQSMIPVMNLLEACDRASPVRVCHLADVGWSRNSTETNTKTKHESTGKELALSLGWCLNTCADNDDQCTREHTPSSAKVIIDGSSEEDSNDRSNVVHGKDDSSALINDLRI